MKSNALENAWLKLYFNATAIADLAENDTTSPAADIQVAAHTAFPGRGSAQNVNEAAYGGYLRKAVARTTGGWTVTANSVSPVAAIVWPTCTSGNELLQFWSLGLGESGATAIDYIGVIGSKLGAATVLASDVFTIPDSTGLAVDDRITFFAVSGQTMPAGITEGVVYFVKTVSSSDVTVSATLGGSVVNITAAGQCYAFKVTPLTIGPLTTPSLSTDTAIIED